MMWCPSRRYSSKATNQWSSWVWVLQELARAVQKLGELAPVKQVLKVWQLLLGLLERLHRVRRGMFSRIRHNPERVRSAFVAQGISNDVPSAKAWLVQLQVFSSKATHNTIYATREH